MGLNVRRHGERAEKEEEPRDLKPESRRTAPCYYRPMILEPGRKILVVHRKLFAEDLARYFVGTVEGYEVGIAKVTGRTYVRNTMSGEIPPKQELRTKIFALSSGTLIVYELPEATNLSRVKFVHTLDGKLTLTDGDRMSIDLTEAAETRRHQP